MSAYENVVVGVNTLSVQWPITVAYHYIVILQSCERALMTLALFISYHSHRSFDIFWLFVRVSITPLLWVAYQHITRFARVISSIISLLVHCLQSKLVAK